MKPLSGVRIAVTRPASQSAELAEPLAKAGATVHVCPLIRIERRANDAQLRQVLTRLREFDWLVFTSTNGVEQFMQVLSDAGLARRAFTGCKVACVGPATAAAAARHGFTVDAMPSEFLGTAIAEALGSAGPLAGRQVLIARAAGGGAELPAQLRARGAAVEDLELYRSVGDAEGAARLNFLMRANEIDLLTFTSGSAITYFVQQVGNPADTAVAVIGPSTAKVARSFGMRVDIEANPHTTAGLITAILDYYAAAGGNRRSDAGK